MARTSASNGSQFSNGESPIYPSAWRSFTSVMSYGGEERRADRRPAMSGRLRETDARNGSEHDVVVQLETTSMYYNCTHMLTYTSMSPCSVPPSQRYRHFDSDPGFSAVSIEHSSIAQNCAGDVETRQDSMIRNTAGMAWPGSR